MGGKGASQKWGWGTAAVAVGLAALVTRAMERERTRETGALTAPAPSAANAAPGNADAALAALPQGVPSEARAVATAPASAEASPTPASRDQATSTLTPRVFELGAGAPPPMPGTSDGFVSQLRAITIAPDAVGALTVGDRVTLPLPTGTSVVAAVERISVSLEGDRSWSGHLEGHGRRYPVTFTQGDVAAFATIASPEGLFALEALHGAGAIFRDERERHQNPSLSCAVLPD